MKKLYLASGNPEKVREAEAILKIPIEIANIETDEVQSMDLDYVTRRKAEEAFKIVKSPLIVDDVGFEIEAWNSFPGPLVKFLFKSLGNAGVLKLLENEKNRNVKVQAIVGYHDGKEIHTFLGERKAKIAFEERGSDGWGFDSIIIPEGETKTIAELGFDHKNKYSHRALALVKLKEYLTSHSL